MSMVGVQGVAAAGEPVGPSERVRVDRSFSETSFTYSRAATRDLHEYLDTHDVPETLTNGTGSVGCSFVGGVYGPVCAFQTAAIAFSYSSIKDDANEAAGTGQCIQLVSANTPRVDSVPFSRVVRDSRCFG